MVYKKFIAKTHSGSEYLYMGKTAHGVSAAGANQICKLLNDLKWNLKDGETWHVYNVEYDDDIIYQQCFKRRKGILYECHN